MARFWDWRGSGVAVADEPPGVTPEPQAQTVELYTERALVIANVDPDGRRLSDILNSSSHLRISDARSISFLNGVEGSEGEGPTSIATEDILFAMPPEHASPRQMRVHRRQHRVRITTGPFVITGNAHVIAGTRLDLYVLRSRMRFLALTQAHVSSLTDPAWERPAPVALVNVQPVRDLTEVLTIS